MLSDLHVQPALEELCAAFGRPFGASESAMVGAWRRALNDLEPDELRYAVARLAKESDKFPVPKRVREVGFHLRAQRLLAARAQQRTEHPDAPIPFCSRCNASTLITDPWGRLRPRHADNCPGLHPTDLEIQRLTLTRGPAA